jgi:hypothetical protein
LFGDLRVREERKTVATAEGQEISMLSDVIEAIEASGT